MGRIADFFREQSIPLAQQQRAKMISLDREVEELESKVKVLETENLHLKAEVNPLKREIERLKNQMESKGASAGVHTLEPTEIEMMKFIGNRKGCTADDICKGMELHSVPVEHFLGRLLKSKYLDQSHVPMVGAWYALSDKGNAYLVEKQLVPLPGAQKQQPNNPKGHPCDHCGSVRLRRAGAVPDPTFGAVGVKAFKYTCLDCGGESAFTNDESSA